MYLLHGELFPILLLIVFPLVFLLYLSIWLSTLVHELGHVIVSLLIGQPVISIRIGKLNTRFKITFEVNGTEISISPVTPLFMSLGFTNLWDTMLPVNHIISCALGGSASNFIVALICCDFLIKNLEYANVSLYWLYLYAFLIIFVFINLIMLFNLFPFGYASDGWHIRQLWRFRNGPKMIIYHTMPRPIWVQYEGTREEFPEPSHMLLNAFRRLNVKKHQEEIK